MRKKEQYMKKQRILVTQSSMPSIEEYIEEIKPMWENHWLTNMGQKHQLFQEQLISYFGAENVELFTNGHMALEMTIQAMSFPIGSEIITSPFTFASTTHAIVRNGLIPVFCDIDEYSYCIDANKIESLITDKTVAIMPIHVYGNICDVDKIDELARKYGLKVIYDAAHTFGEKYKETNVANFGDASCLSFHATKVFNSIEGGAVVYKDIQLGKRLYNLKNFGILDENTVVDVGANAKMNEFCAAMGICNLRHIDEEIAKRRIVYDRYVEGLKEVIGVSCNRLQDDVQSNYAYFPIIIDESEFGISRDALHEVLMKKDIVTRKYFYPLITDFECYRNQYTSLDTPIAKKISEMVMTLPMYADLDLEIVDYIIELIAKVVK